MGLTEYALSQALYMAVNHLDSSGIVLRTAVELDRMADDKLGLTGSEKLQHKIVAQVLLPMCKELLKEDPDGFRLLCEQQHESFRSNEQQRPDSNGIHGARQNFGPVVR